MQLRALHDENCSVEHGDEAPAGQQRQGGVLQQVPLWIRTWLPMSG